MKTINNHYLSISFTAIAIFFMTIAQDIIFTILGLLCLCIAAFFTIILYEEIRKPFRKLDKLENDFIQANRIIANQYRTIEEKDDHLSIKQSQLKAAYGVIKTGDSLLKDNQEQIKTLHNTINDYKLILQTEQERCITDKRLTEEFIQSQHTL